MATTGAPARDRLNASRHRRDVPVTASPRWRRGGRGRRDAVGERETLSRVEHLRRWRAGGVLMRVDGVLVLYSCGGVRRRYAPVRHRRASVTMKALERPSRKTDRRLLPKSLTGRDAGQGPVTHAAPHGRPELAGLAGYVDVVAKLVAEQLDSLNDVSDTTTVLFSAHGVPVSYVEEAGDPYKRHIEETGQKVTENVKKTETSDDGDL